MTNYKKTLLVLLFITLTIFGMNAKSRKNDEKRFQMGFGFTASSANVFQFIQSIKSFKDGNYSYMTTDGNNLTNLSNQTKQALITSNMLTSMQIGFQWRILAHIFMSELDIIAQPIENMTNARCDFIGMYSVGIRCPKWIMPYFLVGANFTMSLYPDKVKSIEKWRDNATTNPFANKIFADNWMWQFGVNAKFGIDVKFKHFSIGCYAMYQVKDISDFEYKLKYYFKTLPIAANNDVTAAGLTIASHCVVGASICWYIL